MCWWNPVLNMRITSENDDVIELTILHRIIKFHPNRTMAPRQIYGVILIFKMAAATAQFDSGFRFRIGWRRSLEKVKIFQQTKFSRLRYGKTNVRHIADRQKYSRSTAGQSAGSLFRLLGGLKISPLKGRHIFALIKCEIWHAGSFSDVMGLCICNTTTYTLSIPCSGMVCTEQPPKPSKLWILPVHLTLRWEANRLCDFYEIFSFYARP